MSAPKPIREKKEQQNEAAEHSMPENSGRAAQNEGAKHFRLLVAAGGTGGHLFPALALARLLRERAMDGTRSAKAGEIVFLGTGRAIETKLIPAAGFSLIQTPAAGLKGMGGLKLLRNLEVLPRSAWKAAGVLQNVRPDVVVGMGGYAAGPVMLEAALRNIPTLLIEPNALPGFTNRVLGPVVSVAALGFEETARFYGTKARVTGQPVRPEFFSVPARMHTPPWTILVMGGSQGAKAINSAVTGSLPLMKARAQEMRIIHQTGEADYNAVQAAYDDQGVASEIHAFIDNMPEALTRADLVISRSGAMTLAELSAAGRAAILVPFPGAADQHQLANARTLEGAGAARVILQQDLTPELLLKQTFELLADAGGLARMEQAARTFARPDATGRIADLIEELVLRG